MIYGAEGTQDKPPFKGRIDVSLSVDDHPEYGMYLHYSKTGGEFREHYFSMGNASRLSEITENRDGDLLSVALFVPVAVAWLAVEDFITGSGERSVRIDWVRENDLPPEAFPSKHI